MEVTNVKFHCKICVEFLTEFKKELLTNDLKKKRCNSFFVIRFGSFVFNCFKTGYINVTGVKKMSSINTALDCLKFIFKFPLEKSIFHSITVDNISAKCKQTEKQNVNLFQIKDVLRFDQEIVSVKYNRERFPNMFIKLKYGLIIWSPNNIVCCVGIKSIKDLNLIEEKIQNIVAKWRVVGIS